MYKSISCLLIIAVIYSCNKDNNATNDCFTDATTTREIVNKKATIQMAGDKFYIVEAGTIDTKLNPCNLPKELRVDNLQVIISGDVKATVRNTMEPCCTEDFVISNIIDTSENLLIDLTIINTETQAEQTGEEIVSQVKCSASNLCYNFSNFEVVKASDKDFIIRTKGTFPKGYPVCLQAVYYKDTTLKINIQTQGQYLLHFYNRDALFKTDTVVVN